MSPSSIDLIAAWRMRFGVVKSGSPTPREMTPSVDAISSKNRRMPEAETTSRRLEIVPRLARCSEDMGGVYVLWDVSRHIETGQLGQEPPKTKSS